MPTYHTQVIFLAKTILYSANLRVITLNAIAKNVGSTTATISNHGDLQQTSYYINNKCMVMIQ